MEELQQAARTNLLLNAVFKDHVCEIQLTFYDFDQIKRYSHKHCKL